MQRINSRDLEIFEDVKKFLKEGGNPQIAEQLIKEANTDTKIFQKANELLNNTQKFNKWTKLYIKNPLKAEKVITKILKRMQNEDKLKKIPALPKPVLKKNSSISREYAYALVKDYKIRSINDKKETQETQETQKTQNTLRDTLTKVATIAFSILTVIPALIWVINQTQNYFHNREIRHIRF